MEDQIARFLIFRGAALRAWQRILRTSEPIQPSRSLFICMTRRFPPATPELLQLRLTLCNLILYRINDPLLDLGVKIDLLQDQVPA